VIDGDTFEVARRIGNSRFVRLAGVNAPELGQPGGKRAKNLLRRKIEGRVVSIIPKSYGRTVAAVRHKRTKI